MLTTSITVPRPPPPARPRTSPQLAAEPYIVFGLINTTHVPTVLPWKRNMVRDPGGDVLA